MNGSKMMLKKSEIQLAVKALLQIGNYAIDARTAYWLGRNFKNLQSINEKIIEHQNELIKQFGTHDAEADVYKIEPEINSVNEDGSESKKVINPKYKEANDQFQEYLNEYEELEIMVVSLNGIGNIPMNHLLAINFMIKEPIDSNLVLLKK